MARGEGAAPRPRLLAALRAADHAVSPDGRGAAARGDHAPPLPGHGAALPRPLRRDPIRFGIPFALARGAALRAGLPLRPLRPQRALLRRLAAALQPGRPWLFAPNSDRHLREP